MMGREGVPALNSYFWVLGTGEPFLETPFKFGFGENTPQTNLVENPGVGGE